MPSNFQRLSQFQIERSPCSLTFQRQTSHLFVGDAAGNLYCHDAIGGARLATIQWHEHPVVAVGCDRNYLYSFDRLQNLVVWNINTLQIDRVYSLEIKGGMPFNSTPQERQNFRKGDIIEVPYWQKDSCGKDIRLNKPVLLWTVAIAHFTHSSRYLIFGVDDHPNALFRGVSNLYAIDVEIGSVVREFDWQAFFSCRDVGTLDAIAISRDDKLLSSST